MGQSGVEITRKSLDIITGTVRPLGDRILIKPMRVKLSSTLIATWKGKPLRGKVIAVGPGEYPNRYNADRSHRKTSKVFIPTQVKVGDVVHLGGLENDGYTFPTFLLNGEDHLMISEKDVAGVE